MKKLVKGLLLGCGLLFFTACNNAATSSEKADEDKIIVASQGSDAEIWRYIAQSEAAKAAGLTIEVREIDGGAAVNQATVDGDVDVNAFQSIGYLNSFNDESSGQLSAIAATYVEPMGIYSEKIKSLSEIPDGATVGLANNPANEARNLRLLETAGLVKLADNFDDGIGTTDDITENPKNLEFIKIDDTTGPRVLPDIDLVLISNTVALEGGLNVLKDSIFHEEATTALNATINVLAVKKERKDEEKLVKLGELYHTPAVQDFIVDKFEGTKVEITKPITDYWED